MYPPPIVSDPSTCECQRWRSASSLDDGGHVITTDPGVLQEPLLRALWTKGRKYRCSAHIDGMVAAVEEGVDEYVSHVQRAKGAELNFTEWRQRLLEEVRRLVSENFPTAEARHSVESNLQLREELKCIHKHMVVTHTDKSSHDLAMGCKHQYLLRLWQELHGGTYQATGLSSEQIFTNHGGLSAGLGRLPVHSHRYLY